MYPSIPAGSLPSFSELEHGDDRPDTPMSSIADDVEWTTSSLDEVMSQLESLEKLMSHLNSCIALLSHDSACALNPYRSVD